MSNLEYSVYNETRANLLSPRVTVIDTRSDPLKAVKVLIEGLAPNAVTGLWLKSIKSVPTVPRLTAYDLVYLDQEGCVVHGIELVPEDEAPRFDGPAASALVLPIHSFAASRAVTGDRFILRPAENRVASPVEVHISISEVPPSPVLDLPRAPEPSMALATSPASTAIEKAHPLTWYPQPGAIEPVFPTPTLQPPAPAARAPRFSFLRALPKLRVHVQISITTEAGASPVRAPKPTPVPPALNSASVQTNALPSLTRQFANLGSAACSALFTGIANTATFVGRQTRESSAAYRRWAEAFVFERAQAATDPIYRIPRLGRHIFDFIFPR